MHAALPAIDYRCSHGARWYGSRLWDSARLSTALTGGFQHDAMSAGHETPRRRGRPRESPDAGAPPGEWLEGLSPTALHIVTAARGMLLNETYESLTIERVAFEAGADPSTVKRLFVSRAGLLLAVLDRMEYDAWKALVDRTGEISDPHERRDQFLLGYSALVTEGSASVGLVETVVHGLQDPIVRDKIAIAYEVWRDNTRGAMALDDVGVAARRSRTLASLVLAVIDGITLQIAADPEAADGDAVMAMLGEMVRLLLDDRTGG